MLLPLLLLFPQTPGPTFVPPATARALPPVVVWLADTALAPGARGRAFVRLKDAGDLVVLRVDGDGGITLVYPAAPGIPARVPGGAAFEIPGPDGRASFAVREPGGAGLLVAARAAARFDFRALAAGEDWDYAALLFQPTGGDPLAAALDIVDRIAAGRPYDYDVAEYEVSSAPDAVSRVARGEALQASYQQPMRTPSGTLRIQTPQYNPPSPPPAASFTVNADCSNAIISEGSSCASVTYNAAPTATAPAQAENTYQPQAPAPNYNPYPYYYYDPYRFRSRRAFRDTTPSVPPPPPDRAIALRMRRPVAPVIYQYRRGQTPLPAPAVSPGTQPVVRIVTPAGPVTTPAPQAAAPAAPAPATMAPVRLAWPRGTTMSPPAAAPAPAPAPAPAATSGGTFTLPRPLARSNRRP